MSVQKMTKEKLKKTAIAVVHGGKSAERDVSIDSGKAIFSAIEELGLNVEMIDAADDDFIQQLRDKKIGLIFNALHGRFGEDGCMQGMFEVLGIPYTGAGVLSSAVGMDKELSRAVFEKVGIPMPEGVVFQRDKLPLKTPFELPVVVKPSGEGSSVGISIVETEEAWRKALSLAVKFHGNIIVERYIKGREIQVAWLEGEVLGAIEVIPAVKFYDYEAKYTRNDTKYIFPAPLDKKDEENIFEITASANEILKCEGVTRSDLILSDKGEVFLLEVNTLPGMTSHSLVPKIAQGRGISFKELVEKILLSARLKG